MEIKYFKIYKDLVVRDLINNNINDDADIVGVIKYYKTEFGFYPNFFKNSKRGLQANFWEFAFESFPINQYFTVVKITERKDENMSRNYFKNIVFTLIDSFGEQVEFFSTTRNDYLFNKAPEYILKYTDLQEILFDIKVQLGNSRTIDSLKNVD